MKASIDFPPFPGIRSEGLDFLAELKENNKRTWFKARKELYEDELRWPMRCLVVDVARRAQREGLPLTADPKRSVFRIYRDIRFSRDKRPYKTHAGAILSRTGSPKDAGVVYIHVEPGNFFLAAGFYKLPNDYLRPLRRQMVSLPARFFEMKDALDDAGLSLETTSDDKLKGMPRGHAGDRDSDVAEYLRWKSFLVERPVTAEQLRTPDFAGDVVDLVRDALPLLRYGWSSEKSN